MKLTLLRPLRAFGAQCVFPKKGQIASNFLIKISLEFGNFQILQEVMALLLTSALFPATGALNHGEGP